MAGGACLRGYGGWRAICIDMLHTGVPDWMALVLGDTELLLSISCTKLVEKRLSLQPTCRQGEMARWASGTGRWADCHFVLTRAGFLHWFAEMGSLTPLDGVSLARCSFEDGEAPGFRLIETSTRLFAQPRTLVFRAPSVEDCCEWAIALREMIAQLKP